MASSVLSQIKKQINQLTIDEQLWLLEHIAQRLRASMLQPNVFDQQLAVMATDPDIQRELQEIEREFADTESDGLDSL